MSRMLRFWKPIETESRAKAIFTVPERLRESNTKVKTWKHQETLFNEKKILLDSKSKKRRWLRKSRYKLNTAMTNNGTSLNTYSPFESIAVPLQRFSIRILAELQEGFVFVLKLVTTVEKECLTECKNIPYLFPNETVDTYDAWPPFIQASLTYERHCEQHFLKTGDILFLWNKM